MDPNVQVAFVSVLVAVVTTSGVVLTALINSRPKRSGDRHEEQEQLDEKDVLERMVGLLRENERKEATIKRLGVRNVFLEKEVRRLQAENAQLILKTRDRKPDGRHATG